MTTVESREFGVTKAGETVTLFTLSSDKCKVEIINFGAIIVSVHVTNKQGEWNDVVAGFSDMTGYYERSPYFGCVIGRVGNRIGKGKFILDGEQYTLATNNGPNALHGGLVGFDKKLWDATLVENGVKLSMVSADGEEGYPGEVHLSTTYILQGSEISVKYNATTTKSTPINITNHSYFNLGGHNGWGSDLSKHEVTIYSDSYLPADENCLVTGEVAEVSGSLFDLRKATILQEELLEEIPGGGFDHNFCLPLDGKRHKAASLRQVESGIELDVDTTAQGVHFYTSNYLSGEEGKQNVIYPRHSAVCFETQNWPDAINHPGKFPDSVLRPGEEYNHETWFKFSS